MILDSFGPDDEFLGNQDICRRTGLSGPTVSRLVYTLTAFGYLESVPRLRKFRLGNAPLALAKTKMSRVHFHTLARPLMQEVVDSVGGVLLLGGSAGDDMVCLEVLRSSDAVTISVEVGTRVPMATSAFGRAYLAALDPKAQAEAFRRLEIAHGADWKELERGIMEAARQIDRLGFCVSQGLWKRDVSAVGVPFRDVRTGSIFSFSCGAPQFLMSSRVLRSKTGPALVRMVETLARQYMPV